jgi:hypothetical protein
LNVPDVVQFDPPVDVHVPVGRGPRDVMPLAAAGEPDFQFGVGRAREVAAVVATGAPDETEEGKFKVFFMRLRCRNLRFGAARFPSIEAQA